MANRSRGRGGRSRKRRPAAAKEAGKEAGKRVPDTAPGQAGKPGQAAERGRGARTGTGTGSGTGGWRDPLSVGERPRAPWHPLPLSELLILIGAIGTVIGLTRLGHGGISSGGPALFTGIAAVLIGTIEVTLREHMSGYRSHTLILTLLPLIVFHSAVILTAASLTTVPKLLNVVLLLLDAAIGTVLFKLLRARYLNRRRERTFAGRR